MPPPADDPHSHRALALRPLDRHPARYLERNVDEPYRVYAWLDEELRGHAHEFFYATDVPVEQHELKLTLLGDLVAHAADGRTR